MMFVKCAWKCCTKEVGVNPYRGHDPIYCSTKCKNKQAVDVLRTKRKQGAVEYLGGKCIRCGYDKCLHALHFHHKDPETKEFAFSTGLTSAWEKVKAELDKCELLCANCHAEHHAAS